MHIYNTVKHIHICNWKQKKEMEIKIITNLCYLYILMDAIISIEYLLYLVYELTVISFFNYFIG